ncbi:MAG: glutamyl-tRNA reductase [Candidatus Poribacteria bacterium]|nr:glutamyl-tRNA reductase [Candidatus Poribacteria bacterium]
MHCYVKGINHNTAPVGVRERFAFEGDQLASVLDVLSAEGAQEAFVIATCNRTEFYVAGNPPDELRDIADRAICRFIGDDTPNRPEYWYEHHNRHAITHLFRVASGLDSMVLGEPEILGQVKQAIETARDADSTGIFFNEVFKRGLQVAKRVRTDTAIGVGSVSLASATFDLLRQRLSPLRERRVMLLGTGEIGEQVAQYLGHGTFGRFYIASRTAERATSMAERFAAVPVFYDEMTDCLEQCDAVVCASASKTPLLTPQHLERIAKRDNTEDGHPFLVIDLGHPRNVEPSVGDLPNVRLYAMDDLRGTIEANLTRRRTEVPNAEAIIQQETDQLAQWHTSLPLAKTVTAFRQRFEKQRQEELVRLRARLSDDEYAAVDEASRRLLAKFLHEPTLAMKRLDINDPADATKLRLLADLFDIPLT